MAKNRDSNVIPRKWRKPGFSNDLDVARGLRMAEVRKREGKMSTEYEKAIGKMKIHETRDGETKTRELGAGGVRRVGCPGFERTEVAWTDERGGRWALVMTDDEAETLVANTY